MSAGETFLPLHNFEWSFSASEYFGDSWRNANKRHNQIDYWYQKFNLTRAAEVLIESNEGRIFTYGKLFASRSWFGFYKNTLFHVVGIRKRFSLFVELIRGFKSLGVHVWLSVKFLMNFWLLGCKHFNCILHIFYQNKPQYGKRKSNQKPSGCEVRRKSLLCSSTFFQPWTHLICCRSTKGSPWSLTIWEVMMMKIGEATRVDKVIEYSGLKTPQTLSSSLRYVQIIPSS